MKKLLMLLMIIGQLTNTYAQGNSKQGNLKELKVGDKMPDIYLGTVINNYTGKSRFSDFKGKLIILDFWGTNCSSCIAAWPEMESLQKKFGDKIQIFIVNAFEDQKKIQERFSKRKIKYKMPDLPSIVGAEHLWKLFPFRGVPYHVWIDGNGIVRMRGWALNTYEEKIRDLLEGKEIDFIKSDGFFDKKKPLYSQVERASKPITQYSSFFTKYTDEISGYAQSSEENIIDSVAKTIRSVYLNNTILDLYERAGKYQMKSDKVISGRRVLLLVKDTSQYTDDEIWYKGPSTDKLFRKNRICYEQTVPLGMSDSLRSQYMLEDMNRLLGAQMGTQGWIEKRKMPCYLLVRTSDIDKIKTKGEEEKREFIRDKNGVTISHGYTNTALKGIVRSMAVYALSANDILLDETGFAEKVDMIVPSKIETIEALRKGLQVYDLDIIPGEREVSVLVLKD